jgi:Cytochrome c554 and c-prime
MLLASIAGLTATLYAVHGARAAVDSVPSRKDYVGDGACKACHQGIAESYERTAHHFTSQMPASSVLEGEFTQGPNTLRTLDPNLHFVMSAARGSYYETAVFGTPPDEVKQTERIDLVVGSGKRGQTYLYWKGDRLFELPVTYWTPLKGWVNSPGYREGTADFDRAVVPRCLECHATYFQEEPGSAVENRYMKSSGVLGISCEKCHGPGRQHVELERRGKGSAAAASNGDLEIVNPPKLTRDRQIDVCAECHGGPGDQKAPAFSFVPGERLADYLIVQPDPEAKVDVHGNQAALLERSKCYQSSTKLTCNYCHDVHAPEREAASYSDRCLTCHKVENCGEFAKRGAEIAKNCVDCHMPVQDSNVIVSSVDGKEVKMRVRSHWIKVYAPVSATQE